MKPRSAFAELLRSDDVYLVDRRLSVAPFVESELKLARRPLCPRPVNSLCSSRAALMIENPYGWIVKSDAEIIQDMD